MAEVEISLLKFSNQQAAKYLYARNNYFLGKNRNRAICGVFIYLETMKKTHF